VTKVRDREQVIDAAATVFAEKGFEAARLEEIAAKLGILKGSLYYYASSKLELLVLVQRRRHLELIERATTIAASAAPPLERLGEILRLHLRRFEEFYPESMQWLTTSPRTEASARFVEDSHQLNRRFERILCELISEAVARGDCRSEIDPQVATLGLLGMCNWTSRWYRKDGRLSMDAIVDNYLAIAFHGLSVGAPAASPQL
jgi:TetR/AcrR family transcriptional regulator, cholesterol catabolism regulator